MDNSIQQLRDFGTRSLVLHGLMGLSFVCAVASAFTLSGQVGLVSFVAFVNLTAGLWISHSVHSLGNSFTDDDYDGVLSHL
ncbi:hypothetical protein [Halolamina sediminis]|jgi:hypothetical protein|uniref:hypothetical protein n=1 Tax=Halolamina sediminis TaxID=1480675 RepID=UPI0006B4E2DC|nr:hypothetical protein [Halolamina sediminis]